MLFNKHLSPYQDSPIISNYSVLCEHVVLCAIVGCVLSELVCVGCYHVLLVLLFQLDEEPVKGEEVDEGVGTGDNEEDGDEKAKMNHKPIIGYVDNLHKPLFYCCCLHHEGPRAFAWIFGNRFFFIILFIIPFLIFNFFELNFPALLRRYPDKPIV